MSRQRTGKIWNYFKIANDVDKKAICKYCKKSLSYKSTITNLKLHLKQKHISAFEDLCNAERSKDDLSTVTKKAVSLSHAQAHNDDGHNGDQDKLASSIKEETDDESEQTQQKETDDVWTYFEKIPSNRARCILCKETFNRHTPFLSKHMTDRHRKVVFDLSSDSDDGEDCYTEVVYLEDEQHVAAANKNKPIKRKSEPIKERRHSSTYNYVRKIKENAQKNEMDEEIENFGRYVIGLLKKLPKDVCTQLQRDIINMIMTAKLNKMATPLSETINVSMCSVQDGVVLTPSNVIVTTPSNVIHAGPSNMSLPSLDT
ncbi:uncharacterized protein LOC120635350 isoform X3 [Pararge aegeria]|uniref:uncharacterized protein LOC120635350 isoform X3 n=1 Tax=Pararge aegeria TaxID=116150 RepID=UPI0019D1B6DC|nr:uncharacterized protein LOC120635350 isoform X3 [Pararge aegeria]